MPNLGAIPLQPEVVVSGEQSILGAALPPSVDSDDRSTPSGAARRPVGTEPMVR